MIKTKKPFKYLHQNKNNKRNNLNKTKIKKTKINTVGGAKGKPTDNYKTVSNSGSIFDEGKQKYNQCFWISIRDYLNMYRGLNITVGQIKRLLYLPESTDSQQMDYWETPMYRLAVNRLAELFDIRIEFYYIRNGRSILMHNDLPIPQTIVNDSSRNIVPIAFTGGHFELITSGPHLEPLSYMPPNKEMIELNQENLEYNQPSLHIKKPTPHPTKTLFKATPTKTPTKTPLPPPKIENYSPKVFNPKTKEYVNLKEIYDKELLEQLSSKLTIDDNMRLVKLYEYDIAENETHIKIAKEGITNIKHIGLSSDEEKAMNSLYQSEIKIRTENISKLRKEIEKLKDESNTLQLFVNK